VGKDHHCRCGCGGDYVSTSYAEDPRSDVNDKLVEKRLKRAKHLIEKGVKYELSYNNINIVTGDNKALTFYFDDLAK
jgi:hypothetical protein